MMDAEAGGIVETRSTADFGRAYLQRRISGEFPLARHIGIVVESADDSRIALSAPFAPNANFKGTAFGGSLFCVAVLTGWAWMTRYLALAGIAADTVIQGSTMRYVAPVHGELRAVALPPPTADIERFLKMMRRAGRGRIRLKVHIHEGQALATEFEGVFAAALSGRGAAGAPNDQSGGCHVG